MKKLLIICAALTLLVSAAQADILWDQYAPDPLIGAANDFDAGCPFGARTDFQANDVSFGTTVRINTISTVYDYYNDPGQDLISITSEAYLMIVPKVGNLTWPANDPRTYGTVAVSVSIVNIGGVDYQELSATGLAIDLPAGDYWVSFNPITPAPIGLSNQHYIAATQIGDGLLYAPACSGGPWFSSIDLFGANFDSTLRIEGLTDVVATEDTSWGVLKALYR